MAVTGGCENPPMIRRLITIALLGLLGVVLLVLAYVLVQANRRPVATGTKSELKQVT